mmetsp:Transcript_6117/g.28075  ORF Transcript_6117/g.28075 Transcript_6117/m.28075 type:complete len:294 (-) Transcript_6117:1503-2384(-)
MGRGGEAHASGSPPEVRNDSGPPHSSRRRATRPGSARSVSAHSVAFPRAGTPGWGHVRPRQDRRAGKFPHRTLSSPSRSPPPRSPNSPNFALFSNAVGRHRRGRRRRGRVPRLRPRQRGPQRPPPRARPLRARAHRRRTPPTRRLPQAQRARPGPLRRRHRRAEGVRLRHVQGRRRGARRVPARGTRRRRRGAIVSQRPLRHATSRGGARVREGDGSPVDGQEAPERERAGVGRRRGRAHRRRRGDGKRDGEEGVFRAAHGGVRRVLFELPQEAHAGGGAGVPEHVRRDHHRR